MLGYSPSKIDVPAPTMTGDPLTIENMTGDPRTIEIRIAIEATIETTGETIIGEETVDIMGQATGETGKGVETMTSGYMTEGITEITVTKEDPIMIEGRGRMVDLIIAPTDTAQGDVPLPLIVENNHPPLNHPVTHLLDPTDAQLNHEIKSTLMHRMSGKQQI